MAVPLRDDAPTRRTPWVTIALILLNVVVFLFVQPVAFQRGVDEESPTREDYQLLHDGDHFVFEWGAVPCEVMSGRPLAERPSTCRGERPPRDLLDARKVVWLALLTSMFLHGGVAHLLGNMLFLWVFGNNVEDRLGHGPYLGFYLIGGLVAALGFTLSNPHSLEPMLGASGAIAAVMGAYLVFKPRGKVLTVVATAAFQVVYVPAFVVLGLFFVTQFLLPEEEKVAWQAHAVGMVFGAVVALLLARWFPDPDRRASAEPSAAAPPIGSAF